MKGQSRLQLLRRPSSFRGCSALLKMFYNTVVASEVFYTVESTRQAGQEGQIGCGLYFQLSSSSGNGLVEQKFTCELLSLQICTSYALSETGGKWQRNFASRPVYTPSNVRAAMSVELRMSKCATKLDGPNICPLDSAVEVQKRKMLAKLIHHGQHLSLLYNTVDYLNGGVERTTYHSHLALLWGDRR
ncbi:hypothetical protein CRENBAI_011090 [Crenichthys baileyi]|uniref:Uncharacterized protein n=1 Tax=Crenichthys baileyi TaxID=28760 RepID=A0AAV9SET3_9TELE